MIKIIYILYDKGIEMEENKYIDTCTHTHVHTSIFITK